MTHGRNIGQHGSRTFLCGADWLAAARARGRKGGRPRKLTPKKQELLYDLYDSREHTISEICHMVGISRGTLYEYLRRRPEGWSPT